MPVRPAGYRHGPLGRPLGGYAASELRLLRRRYGVSLRSTPGAFSKRKCSNVLKNKGYHREHNFGHDKQTLSSVLVALNLIAFSLHAACDACEPDWQKAREICGVRNRIFNILWSLTAYLGFPTWRAFLKMVATSRPPPP